VSVRRPPRVSSGRDGWTCGREPAARQASLCKPRIARIPPALSKGCWARQCCGRTWPRSRARLLDSCRFSAVRGCLMTIVGLFVLVAIVGAIAGGNSSGGSSGSSNTSSSAASSEAPATASHAASSKPEEAPSESRSLPVASSAMNTCARLIRAGSHTSCQLAENVNSAFQARKELAGVPPATVTAYSPVTHKHYKLHCVLIDQRTTVDCATGTASVAFPLETSGTPQSESPTPPSESSSSGPSAASSPDSSSEEDQAGSPSHAGDQKFCEEHECIGDFTSEEGTVVECSDGTYSHAGGLSGACSDHGGEADK
jgi:hypothetical protein